MGTFCLLINLRNPRSQSLSLWIGIPASEGGNEMGVGESTRCCILLMDSGPQEQGQHLLHHCSLGTNTMSGI